MPEYRRWRVTGASYFFTAVTAGRRPLLTTPLGRAVMRTAFAEVRSTHTFDLWCAVLLPDHLHCIWVLPAGDDDYSTRWSILKRRFSQVWREQGGGAPLRSASQAQKREVGVWQRRFWEHVIRNDNELLAYRDYIHLNPVKHGYVRDPLDWRWSSVHRHLRNGWLDPNWTSAPSVGVTIAGEV